MKLTIDNKVLVDKLSNKETNVFTTERINLQVNLKFSYLGKLILFDLNRQHLIHSIKCKYFC